MSILLKIQAKETSFTHVFVNNMQKSPKILDSLAISIYSEMCVYMYICCWTAE